MEKGVLLLFVEHLYKDHNMTVDEIKKTCACCVMLAMCGAETVFERSTTHYRMWGNNAGKRIRTNTGWM